MFADRRDAGRQLAERLASLASTNPIVIALPRGGVPVAAEVAEALRAPLDVIVVRKLGVPWQPELGLGAIAEGGVRVLNHELVTETGITAAQLESVTARERMELDRRVVRYRGDRPAVDVADRAVILVDDGLATGYTARAAVESLRHRRPRRIVLAVPVAPEESVRELSHVADEVVAVDQPPWFFAIGQFYDDFSPTSDDEVTELLDAASARVAPHAAATAATAAGGAS